jgi:hypothetical protein
MANASQLFAMFGPVFSSLGFQPAQVIGFKGEASRERCMQALELPELIDPAFVPGGARELADFFGLGAVTEIRHIQARLLQLAENWRWVRLQTGLAQQVGLYLAVHPFFVRASSDAATGRFASNAELRAARELLTPATSIAQGTTASQIHRAHGAYNVLIRERNAAGAILREQFLGALNPTLVNGTNGLPAKWSDPAGPWHAEIYPLSLYMESRLPALASLYVKFSPLAETTTIDIVEIGPILPAPSVVVGAVEVCSLAEAQRAAIGKQVQASQISTLQGYLDGGSKVPLLAPDTTYTITVEYDVQTTEAGGAPGNSYPGVQQGFTFQTDSAPPPKLDPWVMACAPANNELNVFYEDPVTIVFNDQEAIQLFKAYHYDLILNLHAADGLDQPNSSTTNSVTVSNTVPVPGTGPAGYDSLLNLVNGQLPCVGDVSAYQNQQFTADVTLRPCMAYTLDIVTSPAIPTPANQAIVPLYRTRFTTSKYASLGALATAIGGSRVLHRHLSGSLNLPAPGSGQSTQITDQDIETAFVKAGEQALPATTENAITIYWKQANGSGPYLPYCLLIDCTEPLWRTRQEPKLIPANSTDPSFTIVQITPVTALQVQESGSNIAHYFYSTSGTRTIAMLAGSGAQTITLQLHRPASSIFGLPDKVATIVTLPIDAAAPWESDHV